MKFFAFRWLFSTNHKDIGTLYFFFGAFSGIIGTLFSVIMRMELVSPGDPILNGNFQFYNVLVTGEKTCLFIFIFSTLLLAIYKLKQLKKIINFNIFFYLVFTDRVLHLLTIIFLVLLVTIRSFFKSTLSIFSLIGLAFGIIFVYLRIKLSQVSKNFKTLRYYFYLVFVYFQGIIAVVLPLYFVSSVIFWTIYLFLYLKLNKFLSTDSEQIEYHYSKEFVVFKHISVVNGSLFQMFLLVNILGIFFDLMFFGEFLLTLLLILYGLELIITVYILNYCNVRSTFPFYSTCVACLRITVPTGLALTLNATLGVWEPIDHPLREPVQRGLLGYTAKSKSALLSAHVHTLVIGGPVPLEPGSYHVNEAQARTEVEAKFRSVGSQALYGKWLGESVPKPKFLEEPKDSKK